MFIDPLEIEEILSEYYDFTDWTDQDWEEVDRRIEKECNRRGIFEPEDGDEEYYAVCDGIISNYLKEN